MLRSILNVLFYVAVVVAVVLGVWLAVKLWKKFGMTAKIVTPVWNWLNNK